MKGRTRKLKRWSQRVTESSNALDLEAGVFGKSPHEMAVSLKRSAEKSKRRKASPFRSAMSMLIFYGNRAGKNLSPASRRKVERAKDELRELYGKPATSSRRTSGRRTHPSARRRAR